MSQTEFGKRLGVSRSVINNIELNALARPDQKLSLYKLICSKFNVNEEWLLNGVEPMFIQSSTFNLDDFFKAKGATNLELEIIKTYFELDPKIRKATLKHFKNRLIELETTNPELFIPDTLEEFEALYLPVDIDDSLKPDAE